MISTLSNSVKATSYLILLACMLSATANAQSQNPAPACKTTAQHSAFDFWLGTWEVYGKQDKSGPKFGVNRIEKQLNGCLVIEYWSGSAGSNGTSMNYYDGTKNKWVQHWVSDNGTVINIEGDIQDTSMVLVGNIFYQNAKDNPIRDFRGKWTPNENGTVRQFFEESIDGGKTWYPWFEGVYFKVE